jgi:hypothetical protein
MTPPHFYIFYNYLPFEEDLALYLNKLEFPLPKDNLYKFDWFWPAGSGEEDFKKKISVFLLFRYHLPLEKGYPLLMNKLNPIPLRMICAKSGWNWSSGSGEEVENVKVCRRTDGRSDRRTPDNGRSEKLTWAFSSGELKIKYFSYLPTHRSNWWVEKGKQTIF